MKATFELSLADCQFALAHYVRAKYGHRCTNAAQIVFKYNDDDGVWAADVPVEIEPLETEEPDGPRRSDV